MFDETNYIYQFFVVSYHQLASAPPYGKQLEMFVVRHGESEANVQPKIYERKADHSMSLSEKGKSQAMEAGKYLKEVYQYVKGGKEGWISFRQPEFCEFVPDDRRNI